jgi:tetratricopeptide (TPR) repeat protein
VLALAAAEKGGGRNGKQELTRGVALLRESAATLGAIADAAGGARPAAGVEAARAEFALAVALLASGAKPDAKEALIVHAGSMARLWRTLDRSDLAACNISQLAERLAAEHERALAHADGASEAQRVSELLREAIAFEEGGAGGHGGPLTPVAHALRLALARLLAAAGALPDALLAASAAIDGLSRGLKPPPSASAASTPAPKRAPGTSNLAEAKAAAEAALATAQAAAAAESRALEIERTLAHAKAYALLATLQRAAGRAVDALRSERDALELLTVRLDSKAVRQAAARAGGASPAAAATADKFLDGLLAAEVAERIAALTLGLAVSDAAQAESFDGADQPALFDGTRKSLEVALRLAQSFAGAKSVHVARVLELTAATHDAAGEAADAVECLQRAASILSDTVGITDPRYLACMREQARLLVTWTAAESAHALARPIKAVDGGDSMRAALFGESTPLMATPLRSRPGTAARSPLAAS